MRELPKSVLREKTADSMDIDLSTIKSQLRSNIGRSSLDTFLTFRRVSNLNEVTSLDSYLRTSLSSRLVGAILHKVYRCDIRTDSIYRMIYLVNDGIAQITVRLGETNPYYNSRYGYGYGDRFHISNNQYLTAYSLASGIEIKKVQQILFKIDPTVDKVVSDYKNDRNIQDLFEEIKRSHPAFQDLEVLAVTKR